MRNNVFFTVNQAVIVLSLIYMKLIVFFAGVQSEEHIVTKSQTRGAFLVGIITLSALLFSFLQSASSLTVSGITLVPWFSL